MLRLSDGQPHPLAPVDPTVFHVDYGEGKTITKIVSLISENRLVVVATVHWPIHRPNHGDILIWDWRSGRKMLVSLLDPRSVQNDRGLMR